MRTEEPTLRSTQHPAQQPSKKEGLGRWDAHGGRRSKSKLVYSKLMGGQTIPVGILLSSPECEHADTTINNSNNNRASASLH